MSSFKRRTPCKQVALPPGTRACPISTSTVLTSSGLPSLDDILGGGVPLSCSLAVLAPDSQTAYGELVQRYFVAQGIARRHRVCIVHEDALSFVKECMWMPTSSSNHPMPLVDEDDAVQNGEKIKIAWRYEQMKNFETTMRADGGLVTISLRSADHFCDTFDLTCRIPVSVLDEARDAKRLIPLNLTIDNNFELSMDGRIKQIKQVLATMPSTEVVRLCIPALGSPEWGEHCPAVRDIFLSRCSCLHSTQDILRFLYALRRLLRRYPHACACVSLAPHFCTDLWAGSGWVQKVGWVTDATISMSGFGGAHKLIFLFVSRFDGSPTANPALTALFPSHHGLVQIHKLPAPHSIIPTSDKCSTLRGLSSSAGASIGTGENNLAFKCMRKRLIFETMHLDFEGGMTERRTTPSSTAINLDVGPVHTHVGNTSTLASVAVEVEETSGDIKRALLEGHASQNTDSGATVTMPQQSKKAKKKVAFHSDKPDLYDF
ncbi:PAXNEB-domain-containing protein [Butyriboletus roseoflavus]|nr:PAXNEB-domain-containing protein [Butyriboletus roseoflavus]